MNPGHGIEASATEPRRIDHKAGLVDGLGGRQTPGPGPFDRHNSLPWKKLNPVSHGIFEGRVG